MWHEARRQEKMVRAKMVDNAKRNERRKQFYESVRKEPEGFMQLHGQRMHVHVDPSEAADSPNAMRKWQGDPNILIDRFDVRVYLDSIPETASNSTQKNMPKDDVIELQCYYERYRILVFNEFRKVNEKQFLNEIAAKEFWPAQQQNSQSSNATYKKEIEKKRKLASKRAAIAFNYADSTEAIHVSHAPSPAHYPREQRSSSSSSDDDFDEVEEIDTVLDTDALSAEQAATLNKIGAHFNITAGAFLQLLSLDRKEQTSTAQIREIDKAKLALSGRHAKADRAVLKRKRALIIGNLGSNAQTSEEATTTLLSFLAASGKNELNEDSSSSESGEEFVRTEFITSFGGEEERECAKRESAVVGGPTEDEGTDREAVVQGPILPNREYRRLLELSRRRSNSPENTWERRERPVERERRERDFRHGYRNSSRSPSHWRRCWTTRSRERERRRRSSRSRSKNSGRQRRRRRSGSVSSSAPSPKRTPTATSSNKRKTVRHGERGRSGEREYPRKDKSLKTKRNSSSSSSRSHSHKIGNGAAKNAQLSHFAMNRKSSSSSDVDSLLSVRSSMSESEKERIERENRKRRIRKTKRTVKVQQNSAETAQEEAETKAERAAKKLRQQMQKALTKTAAQLKEEEEQRQRETMREKKRREEQLLEESRLLKKREREKRKTDEGRERERRESERDDGNRSSRRRRRSSSDE
ncbi:hypothetical protein GPALN_012936 [Globodera pallida]|nr:hypothetical protein GPALN_012936 [Globodera pallida]